MDLDKFYLSLLEVLPKIFYVKFGAYEPCNNYKNYLWILFIRNTNIKMSSAHSTPYPHSRLDQNSGMKNMKKLNTPQAKPLKRSLTETHYGNKKSNKDIYN